MRVRGDGPRLKGCARAEQRQIQAAPPPPAASSSAAPGLGASSSPAELYNPAELHMIRALQRGFRAHLRSQAREAEAHPSPSLAQP